MLLGCAVEALAEVACAEDRPDLGLDTFAAQHFGSIDRRDAQADVADVAIGGKVFIGKYDVHAGFRWDGFPVPGLMRGSGRGGKTRDKQLIRLMKVFFRKT